MTSTGDREHDTICFVCQLGRKAHTAADWNEHYATLTHWIKVYGPPEATEARAEEDRSGDR